jgi:DNA-binding response OmpR family regulator
MSTETLHLADRIALTLTEHELRLLLCAIGSANRETSREYLCDRITIDDAAAHADAMFDLRAKLRAA